MRAIGNIIAEAMAKVGKEGVITVEEAKSMETTWTFVEGMQFEPRVHFPYFVTHPEKMEVVLEDALILINEKKISNMKDLLRCWSDRQDGQALLIIAEEVEGEALATLVVNKLRGTLKCAAVKAPGFGDRRKAMLEDIATLTGGQMISEEMGMNWSRSPSRTGESQTDHHRQGQHHDRRAAAGFQGDRRPGETDPAQIEETTSDYDREKLQERLAKLVGGVAVINVGAATESEMKEKKAGWRMRSTQRARP